MATSRASLVPLVAHQKAVDVVRSQLAKHCTSVLAHQTQVVETHPGQKAQPFHRDDGVWPIKEEHLGPILDHLKANG